MFYPVLFITSALVFYTFAIWTEHFMRRLSVWILATFAFGFICDVVGTTMMGQRVKVHQLNLHTCCGYAALAIMFLHLVWAIWAIWKKGKAARFFHRFSVYAWFIWLVAFITGAIGSMKH